jgi:cation:H+ antiporter
MIVSCAAIVLGLVLLVWSSDLFVDGAAALAGHYGVSPFIIGMVIVGFGTSLPEMLISVLSSMQGNPGIALGNAYGSNIANIGLILGITALICPIAVPSPIFKKELPLLFGVTLFTDLCIFGGSITRMEALCMLALFTGIMFWTIRKGIMGRELFIMRECERDIPASLPVAGSVFRIVSGLVILLASSRMLIWGAVQAARFFGVDDLIIGLTIVAVGTSLPELASSLAAIRKNRHDIALGNVLGSNLFNTLAVVGLAGIIQPIRVPPEVLTRDIAVMTLLTGSLFIFGYNFGKAGRINRFAGLVLLLSYGLYTAYLIYTSWPQHVLQ